MKRTATFLSLLMSPLALMAVNFVEIDSLDNWDADKGDTLQVIVEEKGSGETVAKFDNVTFHYTGWLFDKGSKEKGSKFDSSKDRNQPFESVIGAGRLIKGWDEFIPENTSVGESFTIVIPPELAYGERGAGNVIPGNATLVFKIEILDAKRA